MLQDHKLELACWLVASCLTGCIAETGAPDDATPSAPGALGEVAQAATLDHTPVAAKELFVTDLSVVNAAKLTTYKPGKWNTDPEGGFSFGRLIDNLSPTEKPSDRQRSDLVMNWLRLWETPQSVNGQSIAPRTLVREKLITPWKLASVGKLGNSSASCTASADTDFTCKLSFAADVVPFRLLAIVNRPDLRRIPDPGDATTGSAGQGRFVFGVLDAAKQPLQFTVIFEYMVPVSGLSDIQSYAREWHKLGKSAFGSGFNDKLFELTRRFTKWNITPHRNNGSALLQIRTNEVALADPDSDPTNPRGTMWELREFIVGPGGGLVADTVKQEPPIAMSGTDALATWVQANSAQILSGTHDVPSEWPAGVPFLAASSFTPFSFNWQVPGVSEEVRRAFALSTCNGCHRSETSTSFLHVKNRDAGVAAALSPFLTAELSVSGPRISDFTTLLTQDFSTIKDGKGKDHGHDEDENDGDGDSSN